MCWPEEFLCTAWEPHISSLMRCSTCLSLAARVMERWSLCGFQRVTEMRWKCCAICFWAPWGFSEKCPDCSLQSTTLYSLTLRETRHEIFMSRASCGFYAVSSKAARLLKARWHSEIHCCKSWTFHQSRSAEQTESGPPTQDTVLLGHSWGLPFVCN